MERSIQVQNWLLNFSMGFNIIAPYMEFLHLNWYIAEWIQDRRVVQNDEYIDKSLLSGI